MQIKRIGDILTSFFDKKLIEKTKTYSGFFSCWNDLIEKNNLPDTVAAHSWIKSVEKGLVWIEVDHPACKQILQTKERKLLYDFRYRFPDMCISGISIILCRSNDHLENVKNKYGFISTVIKKEPKSNNLNVSNVVDGQMQDFSYDSIKDPILKEILLRLEKRIIERNT